MRGNGSSGGGRRDAESGEAEASSGGSITWEVMGVVSQFRNDVERYKWYVSSLSTIRFLAILNVTYTLVGLTFLILAQFPPNEWQRIRFLQLGLCVSFFSPLALCTDLVALRGLRKWKRTLLLPWLLVYGVMLGMAFAVFATEVYHLHVRWHVLLLGTCTLIIFTRWRHVGVQFKLMAIYPDAPPAPPSPPSGQMLIGGEVCIIPVAAAAAAKDHHMPPPPKYEDLDQPPQYDEGMARSDDGGRAEIMTEIGALTAGLEGGKEEERSAVTEKLRHLQSKLAALDAAQI